MTTAFDIGRTCLMFNTRKAARLVTRSYEQALRPLDLTGGQFSLLATLAGRGQMAISPLADALGMDRTSLSRALAPLERRELVIIAPDPDDKRSRMVGLTDAGRATFNQAIPLWEAAQGALAKRLSQQDFQEFLRALSALSEE